MDAPRGEGAHDLARARLAQQAVAFAFDERLEEIAVPTRRTRSAAYARQTAMYLAHIAFGMSLGRVAQAFGRDRSTVAHACRMIEDRREDGDFNDCLDRLEEFLRAAPERPSRPRWIDDAPRRAA